jgi:hypothetical protein
MNRLPVSQLRPGWTVRLTRTYSFASLRLRLLCFFPCKNIVLYHYKPDRNLNRHLSRHTVGSLGFWEPFWANLPNPKSSLARWWPAAHPNCGLNTGYKLTWLRQLRGPFCCPERNIILIDVTFPNLNDKHAGSMAMASGKCSPDVSKKSSRGR